MVSTSHYRHDACLGVIVSTYPYAEADLILRVISDTQGKLSFMAKYARKSSKRYGTRLDIFDQGTFTFTRGKGSLLNLNSFEPQGSFHAFTRDLEKLSIASTVCETFDHLCNEDGEQDSVIYNLLIASLNAVEKAATLKEALKVSYFGIANLLSHAGFLSQSEQHVAGRTAFKNLLQLVEETTERELKSKSSLIEIMESLRA